jgi:threonine dehydratase
VEDMAIAASAYDIPAFVTDFRQTEAEKQAGARLSKVILAVEEMSIDGQQIPAPEPVTQQEPVRFPLHHHLDVIHGQGSVALQLEQEMVVAELVNSASLWRDMPEFGAVIGDIGNGCTLSGISMAFSGKSTQVFGAAPATFWLHAAGRQYPLNAKMPEAPGSEYWKDVEIPMGAVPWSVFTSSSDLSGVFEVNDDALRAASEKVFEHCGLHIYPDEAAPLAVALYNQDFRRIAARKAKRGTEWTVGVILQPRKSTLTGIVPRMCPESPVLVSK